MEMAEGHGNGGRSWKWRKVLKKAKKAAEMAKYGLVSNQANPGHILFLDGTRVGIRMSK